MASERDIQDAERAKLEAIVAEHGTEGERASLLFSGLRRAGVTLSQLQADGDKPLGCLPPEPEQLARLAQRAERRAKFGLPAVECVGDPPTKHGCSCLIQALDESGNGAKRHILRRAAALHWSPPPRARPVTPMEEPTPARQEAAQEPPAAPKPSPELEPPFWDFGNGSRIQAGKREPLDPRSWAAFKRSQAHSVTSFSETKF